MKTKLIYLLIASTLVGGSSTVFAQKAHSTSPYVSQVWNPDLGNGMYKNPVINADYSDPDVVCVGDDYYMTASSFNCIPGLPILHSKDLVNWEIIGHAVTKLQPESEFDQPSHGNGVWAPCISYHDGEFYIYWGDPDYGVFMVKAKDPAGKWDDPVCVIPGKGMIDTSPLWDEDGRVYLVNGWANSRNRFASVITVRELNADGTKAISDPVIVFDGNGTENRTCEGPKFYKRNGWYWVMFPASRWLCALNHLSVLMNLRRFWHRERVRLTVLIRVDGFIPSMERIGLFISRIRKLMDVLCISSLLLGRIIGQ